MQSLVTLTDVKTYLNIQSTTNDEELAGFLSDAVDVVEDLIGPIAPQTVTEYVTARGPVIVLPQMPVVSVSAVSVEPWQGATPVDDTAAWRLDPRTGVLRRQMVGAPLLFASSESPISVTYTVGRTDVPGPVNRAILMQVADMWRSQRGSMPMPAGGEPAPAAFSGPGFLAPAVMELLLPYLLPPGVG